MQPRDGEEESAVATTLLVAPHFLRDDFEAFNDFVIWLEEDMFGASVGLASDGGSDGGEDGELLGDAVAVAGFHPLWKFGGCDDEAAIHWEKRSPHPTISLIRAADIAGALAERTTAAIAEANEATLAAIGHEQLASHFANRVVRGGSGV